MSISLNPGKRGFVTARVCAADHGTHRKLKNRTSTTFIEAFPYASGTSYFLINIMLANFSIIQSPMLYAAPFGALTQLWGGTMPESEDLNGKVCPIITITAMPFVLYCLHRVIVSYPVGEDRYSAKGDARLG